MFIILGPNDSGKSILAERLSTLGGSDIVHHNMVTRYVDYLEPLVSLRAEHLIMDRYIWCDFPYRRVEGKEYTYALKQWHNITLLTLALQPLVVLCTHKPEEAGFDSHDDLDYSDWDLCLNMYVEFLNEENIPFYVYDYKAGAPAPSVAILKAYHDDHYCTTEIDWWKSLWKAGKGHIGSQHPKVLIVAERLGPNNMNNLPFETGPTGKMMSELLNRAGIPLGDIAITNMVKAERRDPRPPNSVDKGLLEMELENLKPQGVIFMGKVALQGASIAKDMNIPYAHIPHLGYYNRQRVTDMSQYYSEFKKLYTQLIGG